MANLLTQFDSARGHVEPPVDDVADAISAHLAVRGVLEVDEQLRAWGIDTVLIGSYARHVSIRRVKDVDVFCRLYDLPDDAAPQDVVDHVYEVLVEVYGEDRVERQDRSVKVLFPEFGDLYVDAVPARPTGDGSWEIPQRSGSDEPWRLTNPEQMTTLSSQMNSDFNELYVPNVKLLRQTRRAVLGVGTRPGGFWFEMALYEACRAGNVNSDANLAVQFTEALEAIADLVDDHVSNGADLPNPAVDGEVITIRATDEQWTTAQLRVRDAATRARAALDEPDRCKAAVAFQLLLGSNDNHDHVFPLPADCNADGTARHAALGVTPGDRVVPAGRQRFA